MRVKKFKTKLKALCYCIVGQLKKKLSQFKSYLLIEFAIDDNILNVFCYLIRFDNKKKRM